MLALALALVPFVEGAPPSIEHAARRHGPAIVAVHGANAVRPGFFVAGSGVFVAVVSDQPDVVVELPSGERRKGRVLVRDDDGLALVEVKKLDKDGTFPSLALGQGTPPTASQWLLGIGLEDGKAAPSIGGLRSADGPRWQLDLPLDPGAPILVDERVIAVVVERRGKTACVAVPVERVLSLVKRIP